MDCSLHDAEVSSKVIVQQKMETRQVLKPWLLSQHTL